ncbi:hypothetical protein HKX48_005576 [Thoreauomyces humboldtii]|nr:hypothetical protein HKX48_005576 [Thoreauomyces humboldtii]
MWKSTSGAAPKAPTKSDDDWDTDPDFVNAVDERSQRWGTPHAADEDGSAKTDVDMDDLRKGVVENHDQKSRADWEKRNGGSVKESYGVGSGNTKKT